MTTISGNPNPTPTLAPKQAPTREDDKPRDLEGPPLPEKYKGISASGVLIIAELENAHASEYSEEQYQKLTSIKASMVSIYERHLNDKYGAKPDTIAEKEPYAHVQIDGEPIAWIDNEGTVKLAEGYAHLHTQLTQNSDDVSGPALAQKLAEKIAALTGSDIIKADTALTQDAFDALPAYPDRITIDEEAMEADPLYKELVKARDRLEELREQRAEYLNSKDAKTDVTI